MQHELGKTLLIANPVAKNGKGAAAGARAARVFSQMGLTVDCVNTTSPLHAVALAESAAHQGYQSVIALGGDGVIHEAANGLMQVGREKRPTFGIIPVGSGNDYARTLGMSENVDAACAQILQGSVRTLDVGMCNGTYFVETLSFGIDAAIALDTVARRQRTKKTGNALYFEAGLSQLLFHRDMHTYHAYFDDEPLERAQSLTFAVQLGCTYGGGFRICPQARPDDGFFDICIAHPPLGLVGAVKLFAKAKDGKHVASPRIQMRRASRLSIQFESEVPAQMDGEDCTGSNFTISLLPSALDVLFGGEA